MFVCFCLSAPGVMAVSTQKADIKSVIDVEPTKRHTNFHHEHGSFYKIYTFTLNVYLKSAQIMRTYCYGWKRRVADRCRKRRKTLWSYVF